MGEFKASSKSRPCLICDRTKDGDCKTKEAGNLILCHTLRSAIDQPKTSGYVFAGESSKGAGYGVWVWGEEKGRKPERPQQKIETHYYYPTRDGKPFIRVSRRDSVEGKGFYQFNWDGQQWVSGMSSDRASVPIYRYAEVQAAISQGKPIFWVEGEKAADALWSIGIAATTSIGGTHGYRNYGKGYKQDLAGATVILCPDRDSKGLEYIKEVASDFPKARYCKVFPHSPLWKRIPVSEGLDIADWIAEGATETDVLAAICDSLFEEPKPPAYEAFLAEIDEVYQSYSGNEREFYLEQLARKHQRTVTALKAYYRSWQNQSLKSLPIMDGADFLEQDIPPVEWLIADFLPRGVAVLAPSSAGTGKTTLAYSIAYSVASGTPFGDFPCDQGNVLILQCDESEAQSHRRLIAQGFKDLPKGRWFFYRGFDFTQIELLDQFIVDHQIDLVIVDSYTRTNHYSPYAEKDTSWGDPLHDLNEMAARHNCSMIALHHLNARGLTRGTTSLEANASEVWKIQREENRPERTFVHGKSRNGLDGKSYVISYDSETQRSILVSHVPGDRNENPASTGDRIKHFLASHPGEEFSGAELAEVDLIGQPDPKVVTRTAIRLADRGYIIRNTKSRQTPTGEREYSVFSAHPNAKVVQANRDAPPRDEGSSNSYGF